MSRQLEIRGVDGELKKAAEAAIGMKPNFAYTLKEVAADMHHVFDLGYFSKATPTPEDTRDGVKLIIEVPGNCHQLSCWLACQLSSTDPTGLKGTSAKPIYVEGIETEPRLVSA